MTTLALSLLLSAPASPYKYRHTVGEKATYNFRYTTISGETHEEKTGTLRLTTVSRAKDGTARLRVGERGEKTADEIVLTRYGRVARGRVWPGLEPLVIALSLPQIALSSERWTTFSDPLGALVSDPPIEGKILSTAAGRVVIMARSTDSRADRTISRETTFDTSGGRLISARMRLGREPGPRIEIDVIRQSK